MKKLALILVLLMIAAPAFAAQSDTSGKDASASSTAVIGADTPFQQAADALDSSFRVDRSKPASEQPKQGIFQAAADNMATWQGCKSGDTESSTVMFQKAYDYIPATAPIAKDLTLRGNEAGIRNVRSYQVAGETRRLISL